MSALRYIAAFAVIVSFVVVAQHLGPKIGGNPPFWAFMTGWWTHMMVNPLNRWVKRGSA